MEVGNKFSLLTLVFILSTALLFAQEQVGGPYTVDENTIVLLHFDGNLTNESDSTVDATGNGNVSFLDNSAIPALGQMVYLDNDARSDSSFLYIPDSDVLDLTGNWTIECWVNVLTFGAQASDWHGYPKLVSKKNNFWTGVNGLAGTRNFQTGYEKILNGWVDAATVTELAETGVWYHVASIRDNTNRLLIMMVHDANLNLVAFKAVPFGNEESENPQTNDIPLEIGRVEGWGDTFLNGLMDEVRVSNVVRQFEMPPIIKGVHEGVVFDLEPNTSATVHADIVTPSGQITEAVLHYSTGGEFVDVAMTAEGGAVYSATIPGQPDGTQIKYYITTKNSWDIEVSSQRSVLSDSGAFFGIAVGKQKSIVLDCDFENSLADASDIQNEFQPDAPAVFSDDAISGDYSLFLAGDSTSMLRILSPAAFLSPNDITIDLWIKPDTIQANTGILGKFGEWVREDAHRDWRFGYRLWFRWDELLAGEFFVNGQEWTMVTMDSMVKVGQWHRIIMKSSQENGLAIVEMYDSTNTLIQEKSAAIPSGLKRRAGMLCLGGDRYDYMIPMRYRGKIDGLKIYNYATGMPPALRGFSEPPAQQLLPNTSKTITVKIENSIDTKLHYSVNGGALVDVAMTDVGDMNYEADLPGQELGSAITYYITAVNELGKTLRVPAEGVNAIGFSEAEAQTLLLDFEEGSGAPIDKSGYGNIFTVAGNPTYSPDAATGNYSLYYEGDSSYVMVMPPAPFLINPQVTVDVTFKAEGGLPADGTDLIAKYSDPPNSWRFGYRVSFQADGKLFPELFLVANQPTDPNRQWTSLFLKNDTRVTADSWYRFVLEVRTDSAFVRLYNAAGELLDDNSLDIAGQHLNPVGGKLCIGRSWWDPAPIFKGRFDDIKIYNYALTEIPSAVTQQNSSTIPSQFGLQQNFPNPFNPSTTIKFALPSAQFVELTVFNLLGQKVKTLVNQKLEAGNFSVQWQGSDEFGSALSSGIYFYRLKTDNFSKVRKMMYLR